MEDRNNKGQFVKGHVHSEEVRKKMSESRRMKPVRYWLGKKRSEKTNRKISKANKGRKSSEKAKKKMSESAKKNRKLLSKVGKLGAIKRWEGHTKVKRKNKNQLYKEKYPNGATERKRFTNQRYKARKRNALGDHTFEQWLVLKQFYGNMCLCCKRIEPEIKLTEDHIIPLIKGGTDYIENIQPLCVSCNTKKFTSDTNYISKLEGGERTFLSN